MNTCISMLCNLCGVPALYDLAVLLKGLALRSCLVALLEALLRGLEAPLLTS